MASLGDQKISLEPCLLPLCPYNFKSYLENRSKCCLKTLKNVQSGGKNGPENPEIGNKKWLDTLDNQEPYHQFLSLFSNLQRVAGVISVGILA